MNDIKITVITVCCNSEKTIRTTLESVANQSWKNIENIIVDNKSTDKTLSIIKEYPHVKKIISEHDEGVYDAMNKGIKIATGDVIGFLNSDDFYANTKVLSKVSEQFQENPSLDACYADLIYTDQIDTSKIIRYWKSSKFIPGAFSKGWCPPHPTFFVRRSVYERLGCFNLNYRISSDVELMIRFVEVNKICVQYIPEIWVKMRLGGVSNKSLKNILEQNQDVLRALHDHGLIKNLLGFYLHKIISRFKQFIQKPKTEID